ncbi:MAG: GntR family transcriptional regulator [Halioglobus sp.]|jgi:DNA-binding GntR family transcriptional regulator
MVSTAKVKAVTGPRYRVISEELLESIRSGKFAVGTRMPGELDLMKTYKVSRHTIREALRVLEDIRLIERRRGIGTVVLARESEESYVQMVKEPSELFSYPEDSRLRVIERNDVRLNRALARELKCPTSSKWSCVSGLRVFLDSGNPICWSNVYILPAYADAAEKIGVNSTPAYKVISEQYNEIVQKVEVELYASILDERIAGYLNVEPGTASLKICRRYHGNNGRIFEVSISEHAATNFHYSFEFTRGWQSPGGWAWS